MKLTNSTNNKKENDGIYFDINSYSKYETLLGKIEDNLDLNLKEIF